MGAGHSFYLRERKILMIGPCTGDPPMNEREFVYALRTRRVIPTLPGCIGPPAAQDLHPRDVVVVLDAFRRIPLAEQLWQASLVRGHDDGDMMRYRCCAVHWIDLALLLRVRAVEELHDEWFRQSGNLLSGMCAALRWDIRELNNMLVSQRVRLT